ncbi:MAG TPA: ABC transporter permease [Verrucomicrobiae bacterium]|nr:ABC transporter permease [Verrucomicrobiae bacterium]
MTFLPIVVRELIEAARRRGTYWIRVGAAGAGMLVGCWILLIPGMTTPQTLGMTLFVPLAVIVYLYCMFIGIFRTADCLSEEKREGTLGLLFLTDLKGYDVVLGKLVASSLHAFYGVLAILPVMAIPLLVGGVTIDEFWRVVVVALNMLLFSLAVGMFASSISRDERRAMVVAFVILFFFAAGLPMLGGFLYDRARGYSEILFTLSPGYAAVMAFEAPYRGAPFNNYGLSIGVTHALSWLLLCVASIIVPRTWQDPALGAAATRRRERLHDLRMGSRERRSLARRKWLELNPVLWLVARHRMKRVAVWALLAGGVLIWMAGLFFAPHDWKDEEAYILTAVVAHTILKFWVATESSRRFSLDRQSGALELLLSTPLSVQEIVRGLMMGLERQFGGPLLVVLLSDFTFMMAGRRSAEWVTLWLVLMVVLVADLLTLGWLGMWRGLNSRRPNRAASGLLLRVLVLPWVLFLLCLTAVALSDAFARELFGRIDWDGKTWIIFGGVLSLVVDGFYMFPAQRRLLEQFRGVAAQRFTTKGGG